MFPLLEFLKPSIEVEKVLRTDGKTLPSNFYIGPYAPDKNV